MGAVGGLLLAKNLYKLAGSPWGPMPNFSNVFNPLSGLGNAVTAGMNGIAPANSTSTPTAPSSSGKGGLTSMLNGIGIGGGNGAGGSGIGSIGSSGSAGGQFDWGTGGGAGAPSSGDFDSPSTGAPAGSFAGNGNAKSGMQPSWNAGLTDAWAGPIADPAQAGPDLRNYFGNAAMEK
jgi:hypothetical protein